MSTDGHFIHLIWQNEELSKMVQGGVPFPMLSDGGGRIGTIYGVYDEDAGVDIRGRFIIDPDFVIRAMEVLTPEVGAQSRRIDPPGQSLPARPRHRRGDAVRLAAWSGNAQARPGAGGQGLAGLEALIPEITLTLSRPQACGRVCCVFP
jgi:alkyl hydroperoxide reductase subunit AhpC